MNNQAILNLCWLVVSTLLIFGVNMPIFTFTHFYFFDDTYSLAQGIFHLLSQQEYFLFVVLFTFSLLLPLIKMLCILYDINSSKQKNHRRLAILSQLGKWSMLDVFVIAILAVTFKLSMISKVEIHPGLLIFSMAVILSMMLPMLVMYLQQPLKKVTNGIERHNFLSLTNQQLVELANRHSTTVSWPDYICDKNDLLDIFDLNNQWYFKVTVNNITAQQNGFVLTITIAHPPEIQEPLA